MAYLIQTIAIHFHKASKEIDSTVSLVQPVCPPRLTDSEIKKLSPGANDIKFHVIRTSSFFSSVPFDITIFDLGEFEDLYYATCAKLKELLQEIEIHITNGFKHPYESYFTYHCPRYGNLDPIRVGEFRASLLIYESILYSKELTEVLNKGIVKKSMRKNRTDSQRQSNSAQGAIDSNTEQIQSHHGVFQMSLGWGSNIGGLQDTRNMSCSMICASLAEKYRPIVADDGSLGISIKRQTTPDVPQAFEVAQSNQVYISPYNLEERFKKLNATGGSQMPCICDPECICAAVCASDLTQNCLCEENGLFTRVTQGVDIDDLDVPDLVRRSRQGSETSGSNVMSLLSESHTLLPLPNPVFHSAGVDNMSYDHCLAIDKVKQQIRELQREMHNDAEMTDATLMDSILPVSYASEDAFWEIHGIIPPRISSISYRDTLRQSCSKEYDYSPRRASLAQRLFSSRRNGAVAGKKTPSGQARKAFKQMSKKPFADTSFASLKFALRRDTQTYGTVGVQ